MTTVTPSDWRARGSAYDHRGQAIFVVEEGRGDALVCIHGFPTSSFDWTRVWPGLVARFRVIAPDLVGFGFSAKPRDYAYSLFDQADLVEGLLAARGVRAAHVLAHDYGDTVAQELLARFGERDGAGLVLRSVCFLNGGLFPETHRPRPVQRLLLGPLGPLVSRFLGPRAFAKSFSAVFGPRTQPTPDELDAFWGLLAGQDGTRVLHRLIRYMTERRAHRERWVGALARTTVPLRVIDGAADPVSGAHMVARYRELVPRPDTVLLDDVGHYPQWEAPAAVLEAYLGWPPVASTT